MEQNAELITPHPARLLITSTFDRKDYFLYANEIKSTQFLQVSQSVLKWNYTIAWGQEFEQRRSFVV